MPIPRRRRCSFRGVFFQVDYLEDSTGRRVQVDSLPRRDLPATDDFGKEPRILTFEAFILGEDYNRRAEALVNVCAERDTPGRLRLPYSELIVRCTSCIRREDKDEGGMARFRLSFLEVEKLPAIIRSTGTTQAVDRAAEAAVFAGNETLGNGLAVQGVPNHVIVAASAEVQKLGSALGTLGRVREAVSQASQLASTAASFIRDAQSLVLEPIRLAQQLSDAIELVGDTAGEAIASLYAYQTLEALRPEIHTSYLVNRNALLVIQAVRLSAIAGWARAAARIRWDSFEDALAARRSLEVAIDDQAANASDQAYLALQELRAKVGSAVPREDQNLPRLRRITLGRSQSSIQLAYRLYDDTRRSEELVARNKVKHPSFMPAAVPLQVLARA